MNFLSVENTVESMPLLLFRQYVENLSTGKKQAVEDNTRGI
jgi:hypothetical protein